jgi:dTDP-4-dehydrorhamnose 3,5-epimerase
MKIHTTKIQGCYLLETKTFSDSRGQFLESFNSRNFQEKTGLASEFVQDNQSISKYGVIRGLHAQNGKFAQAKLVRVVRGKVLDVVVDARPTSLTFGAILRVEISDQNNFQLYIPKGCLHGFSVLEEGTIFSYKCDAFYHPESEVGVNPIDQELAIDWGIDPSVAIISDKDLRQGTWRQFSSQLLNGEGTDSKSGIPEISKIPNFGITDLQLFFLNN